MVELCVKQKYVSEKRNNEVVGNGDAADDESDDSASLQDDDVAFIEEQRNVDTGENIKNNLQN